MLSSTFLSSLGVTIWLLCGCTRKCLHPLITWSPSPFPSYRQLDITRTGAVIAQNLHSFQQPLLGRLRGYEIQTLLVHLKALSRQGLCKDIHQCWSRYGNISTCFPWSFSRLWTILHHANIFAPKVVPNVIHPYPFVPNCKQCYSTHTEISVMGRGGGLSSNFICPFIVALYNILPPFIPLRFKGILQKRTIVLLQVISSHYVCSSISHNFRVSSFGYYHLT